jgi:hypothetical protein
VSRLAGEEIALLSTLIFVASPAYVFSIATFTTMPLVLCGVLVGIVLFRSLAIIPRKKGNVLKSSLYVAVIYVLFALIWIVDNITGIFMMIAFLCVLVYVEHSNRTYKRGESLLARTGMLRFAFFVILFVMLILFMRETALNRVFIYLTEVRMFAILDGYTGLSMILLVMGIAGYIQAIYDRKDVSRNIIIAIGMIVSIVLLARTHTPLLWVTALFTLVAGMLIAKLRVRKWTIESLRFLTLIIIFCIFLFSFISYMHDLAEMTPTRGILDAKKFIADIDIQGMIFAAPQDAYIISDSNRVYPIITEAFQDNGSLAPHLEEVMQYRVLEQVRPFLEERDIRFIILPKDIEDNLFWTEETRRGLLFLMRNSKYFIDIHETPTHQVWLYVPREGK